MAWSVNQIWRSLHITFALSWLTVLLFGEILFGEPEAQREILGLPFGDALFILLFACVLVTGFSKWPLYPWYKKWKSKSDGRFKFFGPWNGNQIWRWIHITAGSLWVVLLVDGMFLDGLLFGEDDEAPLPMEPFLIAFFGTIISGGQMAYLSLIQEAKESQKVRKKQRASD